MNPKAVITHSYFYHFDPKQWKGKRPYPPLGTLYAAAVMRDAGYDVALFDTCLADGPAAIIPILEKEKPSLLVIYDDGFNYLTKMCLTNMREAAFELIRIGAGYKFKIIVCSSDATDHCREYLEKGADYVILGEGEETLKELVSFIGKGNFNPDGIKGLAFSADNGIKRNPPRPVITNPDTLPFPAWDLVDMNRYREIWMKYHGYFSLNIATTRGCPYHWNWCAKPIYGYSYHSRSPERVVEEIKYLVNAFGADHFWICDDIFGLTPGWVHRFRVLTEKNELKFRYTIQSRADLIIREGIVEDLAASGAETVWIGAESGSQKVLDAMDKGQTVQQIAAARRKMKEAGIKTGFFLQFGYPGEEEEDIRKTLDMLKELEPDDIGVSVSYPLPGTGFYENVKADLEKKANWSDSDDLSLMYKGTFSPGYYRRLHRYVHHTLRKRQNLRKILSFAGNRKNITLKTWLSIPYYSFMIPLDRLWLMILKRMS